MKLLFFLALDASKINGKNLHLRKERLFLYRKWAGGVISYNKKRVEVRKSESAPKRKSAAPLMVASARKRELPNAILDEMVVNTN